MTVKIQFFYLLLETVVSASERVTVLYRDPDITLIPIISGKYDRTVTRLSPGGCVLGNVANLGN